MSSNNNNTSSSSNNKSFCKVCKDAGCSESQYTSHFVKDQPGPNGKVVCPTLLNQSCRICNQTGHTSSYCKQYKPRPSREEPRHQEPRREEPRREEPRHQEYRRDDYRREEPRHQEYRRDDYRREEPRHQEYRRDDYRREEPRDYRRDDYRREEPRHQDYRREEPRHQEYRREEPREYRREEPRRDDYRREEPRHEETQRRAPYAHPHGPRVRLQLEAPALSAPAPAPAPTAPLFDMPPWGTPEYWRMFQTDTSSSQPTTTKRAVIIDDQELSRLPVTQIDVRKVDLKAEPLWGDEPLVSMDSEHRRILEDAFMASLISDEDFDLIVAADEDNMGGRRAIDNGD